MAQEQKLKREALNNSVATAPPLEQDELSEKREIVTREGNVTVERSPDGTEKHYLDGQLHRDGGPAIIRPNGGGESWWQMGKLHRDGGPAMKTPNGTRCWYQHGNLHRDNGPAVEYPDGTKEYYQNGVEVKPDKAKRKRRIVEDV